jgi:hypothetical protein
MSEEQVKQCAGLIGSDRVDEFDHNFLTNIAAMVEDRGVAALNDFQLEHLARIYTRHFANQSDLFLAAPSEAIVDWP